MELSTRTYTTIDRAAAGWPAGPWDGEPDKVQWKGATTGLPCLAVGNRATGIWCGYVGVSDDHPLHGKDYGAVDIDVHGGLTFADACQPGAAEDHGICHVAEPGEPDHVWWFGFDCAHAWDYGPYHKAIEHKLPIDRGASYKSLAYVQGQCASLASQLIAAAPEAA